MPFTFHLHVGFPLYFGYGIWHSTSGKRIKQGSAKYGIENPNGPDKVNDNQVFSNIEDHHQDTPTSSSGSAPLTPTSSLGSEPEVPSRSSTKGSGSISDIEIANAIASLDQIVGSEDVGCSLSESNNLCTEYCSKDSDNIQSHRLPPLPPEEGEGVGSLNKSSPSLNDEELSFKKRKVKSESFSSCDRDYESIQGVLTKKEQLYKNSDNTFYDPHYETIEDVKGKIASNGNEELENKDMNQDVKIDIENENILSVESIPPLLSDGVSQKKNEYEGNISIEPSYACVKKAKPYQQPLLVYSETSQEDSKFSDVTPNSPGTDSIIPSSEPCMLNDEEYHAQSLSHELNSDTSTPSFPDTSPECQSGNNFVIPVRESEESSEVPDGESTSPESEESLEVPDGEGTSPVLPDDCPPSMGKSSVSREFCQENSLRESGEESEQEDIRTHSSSLNKNDDLENAIANLQLGNFINNLPSPTILSNTREFKLAGKDSLEDNLGANIKEDNSETSTIESADSLNIDEVPLKDIPVGSSTSVQVPSAECTPYEESHEGKLPSVMQKEVPSVDALESSTASVPSCEVSDINFDKSGSSENQDRDTEIMKDSAEVLKNIEDVGSPVRKSELTGKSFSELKFIFDK